MSNHKYINYIETATRTLMNCYIRDEHVGVFVNIIIAYKNSRCFSGLVPEN